MSGGPAGQHPRHPGCEPWFQKEKSRQGKPGILWHANMTDDEWVKSKPVD